MPTPQPAHTFSGLWIPLITPFTDDAERSVDHAALARLCRHYAEAGASGLVACGTTGEAAALSKAEQCEVLQTVLDHAAGLPVVAGYSGYHLPDALDWVRQVCEQPVCGVLVAAPHYIRPSQAGVQRWFELIADASNKPVILYDVPYRTGVEMTLPTLRALARHPRIRAIKDCGGNPAKTQALIAEGQLAVLAGEDHQIFASVACGGAGAIAASAHLQTEAFVQVILAIQQGRLQQARALWAPLVPLISELFAEPNPAMIKSALSQTGRVANILREPLQAASRAFDAGLLKNVRP